MWSEETESKEWDMISTALSHEELQNYEVNVTLTGQFISFLSFFLGSCSYDIIQKVQEHSVNPTHT